MSYEHLSNQLVWIIARTCINMAGDEDKVNSSHDYLVEYADDFLCIVCF